MSLTPDLKYAFDVKTLTLAWRWLNTNSDRVYKGYFRSLYKAYALTADDNIDRLHKDLVKSRYKPEHSTKLYIPKRSGILRPLSLLKINDEIVYLALVTTIAEKLDKKARKNYYKTVFGNLYAGKDSDFFYQRWSKGYVKFNKAITEAHDAGYKWSASFDLTAYYDSIDHKVLRHFLEKVGMSPEFNTYLTNYLETWTAASDKRIYHGHGIPQGPIGSGYLSEVILQHFDEHKSFKKSAVRYFRYVDDIRIFGKTEVDVRKALLELDYISKEVGLFPQSGKINIHKITDIEDEIKSVSMPPEPFDFSLAIDQDEVIKRIAELSKSNKVENETRFKYVLAHADPNSKLSLKVLSVLDKNPHLYQSILRHLLQYKKLSKAASAKLLQLLKKEQLYEEVTAAYLLSSMEKVHHDIQIDFDKYCLHLYKNRKHIYSENLRSIVFVWLLNSGHLKYKDIESAYKATEQWWLISNSLEYIDIDLFGIPSYEDLLNSLLKATSFEVAIKAAYLLVEKGLKVTVRIKDIHMAAQTILFRAGLISKKSPPKHAIALRIQEITGVILPKKNWKSFLGSHYSDCERWAMLLVGYYSTDANAFVNMFDVVNDQICASLFMKDGTIGSHTIGKIGSVLSGSTCKFATKYPQYYQLCEKIHDLRLQSELSHARVKSTKKTTRRIKFKEIRKLEGLINSAFQEISRIL